MDNGCLQGLQAVTCKAHLRGLAAFLRLAMQGAVVSAGRLGLQSTYHHLPKSPGSVRVCIAGKASWQSSSAARSIGSQGKRRSSTRYMTMFLLYCTYQARCTTTRQSTNLHGAGGPRNGALRSDYELHISLNARTLPYSLQRPHYTAIIQSCTMLQRCVVAGCAYHLL